MFVQRPNSVQSSISVGNFTIRRNDPRWPVLNVANQIYGGAFDSRLVRNIREEKGYTYSPQSVFQAMGQAGLYRAVADVRNDVTGATSRRSTARSTSSAPTARDRPSSTDAKVYARGLFVIQNATQSGFSATLNTMYSFGLPKDYPETFQKTVSSLSTEAVKTAAQMLLGSSDSVDRDRRRLHQGEGPARRFRERVVRGHQRQADRAAAVSRAARTSGKALAPARAGDSSGVTRSVARVPGAR